MKDYYRILGVSREAGIEDIKKAYRLKAKLYHPDINKSQNAKENFQLLNEAYRYLIGKDRIRYNGTEEAEDISMRRKYGSHYQHRQNYQYAYNPVIDEEQIKADELDKKFKRFGEKYGFIIFIILGLSYIIGGILDKSTHENYSFIFIILFGISFIGFGFYIRKQILKQKRKNTSNPNGQSFKNPYNSIDEKRKAKADEVDRKLKQFGEKYGFIFRILIMVVRFFLEISYIVFRIFY